MSTVSRASVRPLGSIRFGSPVAEPLPVAEAVQLIEWSRIPSRRKSGISRPIFVVGAPRSGTTVLGACISRACGYSIQPQSMIMLDLWSVFANLHQGANLRRRSALSGSIEAAGLLDALGMLADQVLARRDERTVDHTPWYGMIVPFLVRLFPTAQFVHVIRNGRFVCESLRLSFNSGFSWAGPSIEERAAVWRDVTGLTIDNARFLTNQSYLEVKYEAFSEDPLRELGRVFGFLEVVDWEKPALAELAVPHASPTQTDILLADRGPGGIAVKPRPSRKWPSDWNEQSEAAFSAACGPLATQLGY